MKRTNPLFIGWCLVAVTMPVAGQGYVVVVPAGTDHDAAWREVGETLAAHRHARCTLTLHADRLDASLDALRELAPDTVAFVVPPEWIDDTFVGRIFEGLTRFDDDPLLDCAHGFITGRTPDDALKLVNNTIAAEADREAIPKKFVGIAHTFAENDLAPFAAQQGAVYEAYGYETASIIGVDDSADWEASKRDEIRKLNGASIVYCAGHGMGDWFCAIQGDMLQGITLRSAIVINGTCQSATTLTRYDIDPKTMGLVKTAIEPRESIALNFIAAGAIAQYGSTGLSSWMNVGLAVDGFFHRGQSMGEALVERQNEHLMQEGIKAVHVLPFVEGERSPQFLGPPQNPGHLQSIARIILLGDPAYTPFPEPRARRAINFPPPPRQRQPQQGAQPVATKKAIDELIVKLDDPNAPRFIALSELIALRGAAVGPLIEAMKTNANWQIPKALGAIGDARALDPLIDKLAARPPSPLREVVIEALELISGQDFDGDLDAWRAWRQESKRDR